MGRGIGHVTSKRVLHSNFGCCIGTIEKSATYKISDAVERCAVPIGELVENSRYPNQRENFPPVAPPSRVKPADAAPVGLP